ncbi:MAG: hypothetical protein FJY19_03280 [Bacteroidetes bacterium]|nr:hypothetical protein [Bacteroidota bacterium]
MEIKEEIQDELKRLIPELPLQQQQPTIQAPNGYFEQLPAQLLAIAKSAPEKRAVLFQLQPLQLKYYVAAAVTIGILFFSFYYFADLASGEGVDSINQWAKQEIKEVPAEHISLYTDQTSAFSLHATAAETENKDVALLIQGIQQEEIQRLLNDFPITEMQ